MVKPLKRGLKMDKIIKCPSRLGLNLLIIVIISGGFLGVSLFLSLVFQGREAVLSSPETMENEGFAVIQGNSLSPISKPPGTELHVVREIKMVVTAYSSSIWETDSSPFITAAGTQVRDGVVANNLLAFGTKIRIPEIYGDKIFVIEDRMNSKKGYYHIDIWFPSYWEAKSFGAKRTYVEVIKES